jgi:hypothetical protein
MECPDCNGEGQHSIIDIGCCGNLSAGGECRGDCAIPVQGYQPCGMCGGTGRLEACRVQEHG